MRKGALGCPFRLVSCGASSGRGLRTVGQRAALCHATAVRMPNLAGALRPYLYKIFVTIIIVRMNLALAVPIVVLVLGLCHAPPVLAGSCADVADLLDFIAAESGYPMPLDCPEIDRSDILESAPALRSQVGAYIPGSGRIMLAVDIDTESTLGRSYLLHELVHAAQYRAGAETRVRCEAELEREAYHLQTTWLRQKGEFREAMLLDWAAEVLGRCTGDAQAMDY